MYQISFKFTKSQVQTSIIKPEIKLYRWRRSNRITYSSKIKPIYCEHQARFKSNTVKHGTWNRKYYPLKCLESRCSGDSIIWIRYKRSKTINCWVSDRLCNWSSNWLVHDASFTSLKLKDFIGTFKVRIY
jgi:hypothetical protein